MERGYNRENGKIEKRQKVRRDKGDGVMDVEEIIIPEFLDLRNRETGGQWQVAQAGIREVREVEDFKRQLESWIGCCPFCRPRGLEV